jgi:short subunit dehydrogenase-like uncharacterized protein
MITLFGATGYTGTRIAKQLDRRGLKFRLAGRSEAKLAALSQKLVSQPAWIIADAFQPSTISPLMKGTRLLINCVGPFTDMGERILSSAAVAGVHYLDTTNELGFVYRAQTFDALAKKSRAAVIPACAFEVALADCAAEYLKNTMPGPYQTVDVVYNFSGGGTSRGTRQSALRSLATSWLKFEDGTWTGHAPGIGRKWFDLPNGRHPALNIPSSESVTLPAHLNIKKVNVWMTGSPVSTSVSAILLPFYARFLRSLPGRLALWMTSLNAPEPENDKIDQQAFQITVFLATEKKQTQMTLSGQGAYHLSADIIAYAVAQILQPDFNLCGVLPPAAILEPSKFLQEVKKWGVSCQPEIS